VRKFTPFDHDTIFKEMRDLQPEDFAALKHPMSQYAAGSGRKNLMANCSRTQVHDDS
jgi:hypothetical protein